MYLQKKDSIQALLMSSLLEEQTVIVNINCCKSKRDSVSKRATKMLDVERFNLKKLNDMVVREE